MTTTPETELPVGTHVEEAEDAYGVEDQPPRVEDQPPRYAAHHIMAARTSDLHSRMLVIRAHAVGKTHRRAESGERPALQD